MIVQLLFLLQITFMNLIDRFQIPVLAQIAIRNPQATNLGQRIIEGSINLIDELGFENFTFKKLAQLRHRYTATFHVNKSYCFI